MSDWLIAAIAGAGAVVTVAITGLIAFWEMRDSERRYGDARVEAQLNAGKLMTAIAARDAWQVKAQAEEKRANALDDLIAHHAATNAGPVDGAFQRLLQEWRDASPTGDHSPEPMSTPSATQPPATPDK